MQRHVTHRRQIDFEDVGKSRYTDLKVKVVDKEIKDKVV